MEVIIKDKFGNKIDVWHNCSSVPRVGELIHWYVVREVVWHSEKSVALICDCT